MKSRIKNEVTNDRTHSDVLGLFLASIGPTRLAEKTADVIMLIYYEIKIIKIYGR